MRRLAVFVEGYSELLFINRLIEEIAGVKNVLIEHCIIRGGTKVPRYSNITLRSQDTTAKKFYVLIVDCGGDNLVKSRIIEEHTNLTNAGYIHIIGMRDIRPQFRRSDMARLEQGLRSHIKTSLAPVTFVLGVMEFEAWLLAEWTHFSRVDPSLTVDKIHSALGIDIANDDLSSRPSPADDLRACYQLVEKPYEKGSSFTCEILDYAEIYLNLPKRFSHAKVLIDQIEAFLGELPLLPGTSDAVD